MGYCLVLIDKYSHLAVLVPTRDQTSSTVAEIIYRRIICEFGNFTHLFHDNAANFTSKIIKNLATVFGITQVTGSSFHPNTQGLVEKFNKTIINALRCMKNSAECWDEYIPSISMALRATPSKSLAGFTPFEIATGRKFKTPEEQSMMPPSKENALPHEIEMMALQENLSLLQKLLREGRESYLKSMKDTYDKTAKTVKFDIGQKVLMTRDSFTLTKSPKLCQRFIGPLVVTSFNPEFNTYTLNDLNTGKTLPNFVHVCKLKPFIERQPTSTERTITNDDSADGARNTQDPTSIYTPSTSVESPENNRNSTDGATGSHNPSSNPNGSPDIAMNDPANNDLAGNQNRTSLRSNFSHQPPQPVKIRRSVRIQEKVIKIGEGPLEDTEGRKFYGSPVINAHKSSPSTTTVTLPSQKVQKSILKASPQPEIITRFARFKIPGRPAPDGTVRSTRIKICGVIHAKKVHNTLEFYCELETPFKNAKYMWISEHVLEPPLNGLRVNNYPFVQRPYNPR
jgi:hypothetical protein